VTKKVKNLLWACGKKCVQIEEEGKKYLKRRREEKKIGGGMKKGYGCRTKRRKRGVESMKEREKI